jgi:hypothetical protein
MTLRAGLDALRGDAGSWEQVASVTRQAAHEASLLTLGPGELSWASLPTGLLDTYAELQSKVVTLLEEASQVYTGLSARLYQVAETYERNDEQAARELAGVWDVRE